MSGLRVLSRGLSWVVWGFVATEMFDKSFQQF